MAASVISPRGVQTGNARRRQFSSCDLCRKSRVACDASKLRETPVDRQASPRISGADPISLQIDCSNCTKRGVECTYEWIRSNGAKTVNAARHVTRSNVRPSSGSLAVRRGETPGTSSNLEAAEGASRREADRTAELVNGTHTLLTADTEISRRADAMELHTMLWAIFTEIFEPVLALWTGPDCSPYPVPAHMCGLRQSQLVVSLDWANCACGTSRTWANGTVPTSLACPRCDRSVQMALISSVHAFSLRWLPLVTDRRVDCQQLMSLGDQLWQNARTQTLSVLDKPSYQTVMALYLFGLTPTYQGSLVDENTARAAGELSVDVALRQVHKLRLKRKDLAFSGAGWCSFVEHGEPQDSRDSQGFSEDFVHAENMIYWAAVVLDISASMKRGSQSILISGVFGFEDEPVIRLMRARVQLFHERTETWRQNGFVPTSDTALSIIHRASTWKGYMWKVVGALRETINNGYEQGVIAKLQPLIRNGLLRFDTTFRPLLAVCEKHILFLSKEARLCYYLLQLHYHMGLLLLCSLVLSIDQLEIVPEFETVRRDAVHIIFTTISFGLGCRVGFDKGFLQRSGKTASFISLDPYPHHILASLQLATDILLVYLERGEITLDAFESSFRIGFDALDSLAQSLNSVQAAKKALRRKLLHGVGLTDARSTVPVVAEEDHITQGERGSRREEDVHDWLSNLNPSEVDDAGMVALGDKLFSKPPIVLSAPVSIS